MFPCSVDRLPEVLHVVLIRAARTTGEVREAVSRARALNVNGQHIMMWMNHLTRVYARRFPEMRMDESALLAYASLNGVPESIVRSTLPAADDAEADELLQVGRARGGMLLGGQPQRLGGLNR